MSKDTFLFEIGCEELPSRSQQALPASLALLISEAFAKQGLSFDSIKTFATPRRIAVMVNQLETKQASQAIEKQGPSVQNAYDKNGSPTLACLGFAKSCGASVDELIVKDTPKGKKVVYLAKKPGEETITLLPDILTQAVSKLPISKPMRWGKNDITFVRPVHWIVMMLGDKIVPATILGIKAGQETFGHRFHHPKPLRINKAQDYSMLLYSQGYVIADFETRKKSIQKSMLSCLTHDQKIVMNDALLNEVTGLVEWPVALKGNFDPTFLSVPKEALITSMETHQKCFAIENQNKQLQPHFVLVSNIESKSPETVIKGNERVICARLSDARFFYQQDKKHSLASRQARLDDIIFQKQLGTVGKKVRRITKMATHIAKIVGADTAITEKAASLCKSDLVSEMVYEFPNLQGTMGYYYAINDGLCENTALAIKAHYLPKFSGDQLPDSLESCCIALADRIDTLIGILGINKIPTGDKDPFALRRATLGVLRILIEKQISLDIKELLSLAQQNYSENLPNETVIDDAYHFMMTRLKSWYSEQGVSTEVFEAVQACNPTSPFDFDQRIKAVVAFQKMPEAESLASANKRVANILKKETEFKQLDAIDQSLFDSDSERTLAEKLAERATVVEHLYQDANYEKALSELSTLKSPIDCFFDNVMIMVDDQKVRKNRLALLVTIRNLFTKVADISLLP